MTASTTQAVATIVTQYHKDVYACAQVAAKAGVTMAQKMNALILARYADTCPTFDEYRNDQRALAQLAKDRKLVDNQWVRKPYAAAVKARFGALPVSQSPEAILKAAKRDADRLAKKNAQGAASAGAPAGETQDHGLSDAESIEAIVTRLGLFKCLDACISILAADKSTANHAKHLKAQAAKAAELAGAPKVEAKAA